MERVSRQKSQIPSNLPQLQNLIKRDPQSYYEEVRLIVLISYHQISCMVFVIIQQDRK